MIAILLPDMRGGGAERSMLELSREFKRLGHTVEFVLMRAVGELLPELLLEFQVFELAKLRTRQTPLSITEYIRKRRPKVIIANMWPLTTAAVIGKAISGHRCHLLLVEHNTLTSQYAKWGMVHNAKLLSSIAATYRFADSVAAVSKGSAGDVARLTRMWNDSVKVLYNPIPRARMPQAQVLAKADALWGYPKGQRILTVGSLKDQKNQALLLRAFAHLSHSEVCLMLVGQGEKEGELRRLASELRITDRVIFAGFHPDPSPFYATADLFILSSNYEGFANVIVEAMSFGIPIVSTDCPFGPAEILQNGRLGRLVPVGDTLALTLAIEASLNEPFDRDALIRRAADFAPEIAARKYLDLLYL